ncbi:MAG: TnsA endonuclease N-terminal domain-containing protein [Syntrophales bacterium]
MTVRKIPKNYRSVTGFIPSRKKLGKLVPFESTLERDLLEILEFDLNVDMYDVQPVRITYYDSYGKKRHYVPDVLVSYRRDIVPAKNMKHMLCEVKYLEDLKNNGKEWRHKFKAASRFAKQKGWVFRILTERNIRTPFLDNVMFFKRYKDHKMGRLGPLVLEQMREMRMCTPEGLLLSVSADQNVKVRIMPILWHLIAVRRIGAELNEPFNMKSIIWALET